MSKIFIVNGVATSGKTTFETMIQEIAAAHGEKVIILSTIDYVKEIAKKIGWDGTKTPENRRMLSDLKDLLTRWNDSPHQKVHDRIMDTKDAAAIFIDSREPEDIKRFVEEYNALTVLVQRGKEVVLIGNHADDNVNNFEYDCYIDNSRGLSELLEEAAIFYETFIKGDSDEI